MVDLGKYAVEVLSAYAVTLGMIALLVGLSLRAQAKTKAELARMEGKG